MAMEKFRLDGKVALITGGTRGIGLAIAEALGEAGARLILSARTQVPEAEQALRDKGYAVEFIASDLSKRQAAIDLVKEAAERAGTIDILVNNAGVAIHGDSDDYSEENWRRILDLNLDAVFWCSQAVLPIMRSAGGGVMLNIGSMSGIASNIPQNQVAYNASKAAVHMLTKSLASELAEANIRVNAIAPGYIDTEMSHGGLENPDWAPIWLGMTPMGRAGTADEIGPAALLLCSDAGSYITGSVLVIDGGYTTR